MCQTELNAWPRSGVMEANLLSAELLSRPMLSQDKSAKKKIRGSSAISTV